jgi:hypothetical protein
MDNGFNYDDVSNYTLGEEDEKALINAQNECTFMWSTKEGWPVGVIMSYIYDRGYFWLSVSSLRVRVRAVAREPRTSISITSKGCDMEAQPKPDLKRNLRGAQQPTDKRLVPADAGKTFASR